MTTELVLRRLIRDYGVNPQDVFTVFVNGNKCALYHVPNHRAPLDEIVSDLNTPDFFFGVSIQQIFKIRGTILLLHSNQSHHKFWKRD